MLKIWGDAHGVKNRFLEIRLKLGYKKQQDFAKFLGIGRSKYNRYENNKNQPTAEDLFMAAKKLNMKMEDIIYSEEELEK
jgi:transcriptional regulator with XRE-family HTH domain